MPDQKTSMELDNAAIERARKTPGQGALTPGIQPYAESICKLLNDALATEWVCVLRYRRHHFIARGVTSPKIAEEFLVHADQELSHADQLSERIVQLGGAPKLDPSTLRQRSHAEYDELDDLQAMIRADLVAERVAIETYRQMIHIIGDKDPTTRRILEGILEQEEEHAEELSNWVET